MEKSKQIHHHEATESRKRVYCLYRVSTLGQVEKDDIPMQQQYCRDDETTFVVEWFVKNGIEVWSAMEGQQRFDTHVDKLLGRPLARA